MKKKLFVALVLILLAGLLGTFIGQNTNVPLWLNDSGYRIAVALEKEFSCIDVWEIRSDGEFVYVNVFWLKNPGSETIAKVNDAIEAFLVDYITTEKRVIFADIVWDGETYWAVSLLSCPTDNLGTDKPVSCQRWPWPVKTRPSSFPWVGR